MSAIATPQILVPSVPKHLILTQTQIEDFICDPPLAAHAIFGEVMDEFQKQRLIDYVWVPRVMDSSGFSSFKTRTFFIGFCTRCILIEDHVAGVYYQNFESGQKNFWQYFDLFMRRSPIFRAQIGRMNLDMTETEGKGTNKGPSCWNAYFRNGSHLMLPAPSFIGDAKNQAGKRFNDLGIDEWTKVEATGTTGIDDQLLGRCTRESFNQEHPFWCNHHLFLATAEDTLHPAYRRYKDFTREVKKGNPDYSAISYSFKDVSDLPSFNGKPFKIALRITKVLKDLKARLSKSKWLKEGLGLWSRTGRGWYDSDSLDRCVELGKARKLEPVTSRRDDPNTSDRVAFFLGSDPSKGDKRKSDDGALVALRAEPIVPNPTDNLNDWKLDYVWAYKVRKADATQWSGVMHLKNRHFGFNGICMDAGGGGNWIKPELAKANQIINDMPCTVIPICTPDDNSVVVGNHCLIMFTRADDSIMLKWEHIKGDDNLIDVAHTEMCEVLDRGLIGFPEAFDDRPAAVTDTWSVEKQWANRLLDLVRLQLSQISVVTDNEGNYVMTRNHAKQFEAKGKKDFAYAAIHAYVRFLVWLKSADFEFQVSEEDAPMGE